MNNSQTNTVNMFARIILFFKKYQPSLQPFKMLWGFIKQFQDGMTGLEGYTELQQTESGGQTTDKDSFFTTMVKLIVPMARKAKVWAHEQGDGVLEKLFDVSERDFNIPQAEVYALANDICKALNDNIAALADVRITAAQVADAQAAADSFKGAIGTPQQAQKVAKVGTEGLVKTINDQNALLLKIDGLLIPEFALTDSDMVNEYKNNRRIGEVHHLHTRATVHVYSDAAHKVPVAGAVFSIPALNKSTETDMEGVGEIEKFKGGELSAKVSAAGFKDAALNFEIKNGQHLDFVVVMGV